ncbi:hypothetical protein WJX79_010867 [Trebouxia sp. C0005]
MKLYPQSLAAQLKAAPGNKLEVGVLLRCAMDICSGLQEVHAMGIIMRDLKPANVLVAENGTAVLADFGLARAVINRLSGTKTQGAGTAAYMSPEMFDPDLGDTTAKADIWALGCTIVEMGTGTVYPAKYSTDTHIMNRERASAKEVLQALGQVSSGSKCKSSGQVKISADSSVKKPTTAPALAKQHPAEIFKQSVVESLQLSTNDYWPFTLVNIMSELGSDEAVTKVQSPVIGYVLTTTIKSPHGPEKAHMAYVFRRAMHYCSYSKLTDWSVSANNMPVVVQTLEGALKEYSKSRPGIL